MSRCYNCNSPYHFTNRCPKKSILRCFGCNQTGHKRENCPENIPVIQPQNISVIRSMQYVNPKQVDSSEINTNDRFNRKASFNILFGEKWGPSSYFVSADCLLSKLKHGFIRALDVDGYLEDKDLDSRNQVPHINLHGDESIMQNIANTERNISVNSISYNKDCIIFPIAPNTHFTFFYKNGLKNLVGEARLKEMIYKLLQPYFKDNNTDDLKDNEDNNMCCVCFICKFDTKFDPCKHVACCNSCSSLLVACPICRVMISAKEKIYIA